jgi:hypothetical protein
MNEVSIEAVAQLLGMKPGVGMRNNLREMPSLGDTFTIGDVTDAYLKKMGGKYRVIEIEVRTVYGNTTIYPVNKAANLLAEIAGTKTLTNKTLALAERMGFAIKEVTPARTKYGMKEAV